MTNREQTLRVLFRQTERIRWHRNSNQKRSLLSFSRVVRVVR